MHKCKVFIRSKFKPRTQRQVRPLLFERKVLIDFKSQVFLNQNKNGDVH